MCLHTPLLHHRRCHHMSLAPLAGQGFVPAQHCHPVRAWLDAYHQQPRLPPLSVPLPPPRVCPLGLDQIQLLLPYFQGPARPDQRLFESWDATDVGALLAQAWERQVQMFYGQWVPQHQHGANNNLLTAARLPPAIAIEAIAEQTHALTLQLDAGSSHSGTSPPSPARAHPAPFQLHSPPDSIPYGTYPYLTDPAPDGSRLFRHPIALAQHALAHAAARLRILSSDSHCPTCQVRQVSHWLGTKGYRFKWTAGRGPEGGIEWREVAREGGPARHLSSKLREERSGSTGGRKKQRSKNGAGQRKESGDTTARDNASGYAGRRSSGWRGRDRFAGEGRKVSMASSNGYLQVHRVDGEGAMSNRGSQDSATGAAPERQGGQEARGITVLDVQARQDTQPNAAREAERNTFQNAQQEATGQERQTQSRGGDGQQAEPTAEENSPCGGDEQEEVERAIEMISALMKKGYGRRYSF